MGLSNVNIIVATDLNGVIGCDGRIPWHCSADLIRFRRLTMGGAVIMGRRTYEAIGRPLPGRLTVILTRDPAYAVLGCIVAGSLADGLASARSLRPVTWVCGGGAIYREALPIADAVYLTTMHTSVRGDVTFPLRAAWPGEWECVEQVMAPDHTFEVWQRLWPMATRSCPGQTSPARV